VRTVATIADVRAAVRAARQGGAKIGFVPTMGALHEGHLTLIDRALAAADFVVASVFVNPLQFGPNEDFERYPRDLQGDGAKLASRGTRLLFAPSRDEIYPAEQRITVQPGPADSEWEGAIRPGHFAGVLTVVAKLFNIVSPDVAVFGQKDLQQVTLIDEMIRELNMPIALIVSPTARDRDGLALSSRNAYLSRDERQNASRLYGALRKVQSLYEAGERSTQTLEEAGRGALEGVPGMSVDYFAVVRRDDLVRTESADDASAAIAAVQMGRTRLIDNILLGDGSA
jgi:pantoate--beta-alanine ligase